MAVAGSAAGDWKHVTLYVSGLSTTIDTAGSVTLKAGTVDRSHGIDVDGKLACDDLRDAMYTDGSGTWFNAKIELSRAGELTYEFDYDGEPLDGAFTPDMVADDLDTYPRDPETVPAWGAQA